MCIAACVPQGYAINPEAIYFIEGAGQGGTGANWGDGFSTASAVIGTPGGASDPTRFFKTLLTKKYRWVLWWCATAGTLPAQPQNL